MNTIGNMTRHKLDVTRTLDGFESALIKNLTPSLAQEALFPNYGIYAGRCMSRAVGGDAELGVSGNRVPYWMFRTSNLPSTGSASSVLAVADEPGLTAQDGATHKVLHYAGIEGLEMATTEYNASSGTAYAINQFLTALPASSFSTDPDIVAGAGVVTNAGVVYGKTPIVGIVSETATVSPHGVAMLKFYTLYRPPIEGTASLTSVSAKTAAYTIVAATDNDKTFTTTGAVGSVTFSLPPATVGQRYRFRVGAAQAVIIDPDGTEVMSLPGTGVLQAAGKYLTNSGVDGATLAIECTKVGQWSIMGVSGTWTVEP